MLISLSLWSLDQTRLAADVERHDEHVDSFHVDVMDGHYVDNLLYGPLTVGALRSLTRRPIVAHLMLTEPGRWVTRFADAGADVVVVHPGACRDFPATVASVLDAGVAAGAAVGIGEPIDPVLTQMSELTDVLVMGTAIGVKGEAFDESSLPTIAKLAGQGARVFVDGGIRWPSLPGMAAAGADGVVAGSILAGAGDPAAAASAIRKTRG